VELPAGVAVASPGVGRLVVSSGCVEWSAALMSAAWIELYMSVNGVSLSGRCSLLSAKLDNLN
jgi:hypothetical protein